MDRSLLVETPESIAFSYELAGLGSRFLAVTLDLVIQVVLTIAIFLGLAWAGSRTPPARHEADLATSVVTAIIVGIIFLIYFAYFVLFEALWNGQTPGKKALGIRVLRDGGYPVDLTSSLVRNLIRVGEVAIGYYALSAVSTLMSPENKRLGDYAAGTIVVRDLPPLQAVRFDPLRRSALDGFSGDERRLIEEYARRRASLEPAVRREMAQRIAAMARERLGAEWTSLSDDDVLVRLTTS